MECVDAFVGAGRSFYCLFYEEVAQGDHLSRVYWFSDSNAPTIRLICELEEWLVSLWANRDGVLWAATWDGRILQLGPSVEIFAEVDLLGTIKLSGFDEKPHFIMGEDGLIFENRQTGWESVKFRGTCDVYSVAQRQFGSYWFVGSEGRLICYEGGKAAVQPMQTNMDLHGIAFLDPDTCLIAGDEGVLLLFDKDEWTDITDERQSLPDVHAFKGAFVLSVEGTRMDRITRDGHRSESTSTPGYYISSNEAICVTFHEEAALVFDGISWSTVPFGPLLNLERVDL